MQRLAGPPVLDAGRPVVGRVLESDSPFSDLSHGEFDERRADLVRVAVRGWVLGRIRDEDGTTGSEFHRHVFGKNGLTVSDHAPASIQSVADPAPVLFVGLVPDRPTPRPCEPIQIRARRSARHDLHQVKGQRQEDTQPILPHKVVCLPRQPCLWRAQ